MYSATANGQLIAVRSSVEAVKKVARCHFSELSKPEQEECRLRLYRGPVPADGTLLEVSNNNQSWRLRWRQPRTADLDLNAAIDSVFGNTATNNTRIAP
jgi:hypothetical protein